MVKRVIRRTTAIGYRHVAKPVLFKQRPDSVHKNLVRVARSVQKTPGVRQLPKLWAHRDEAMLKQELFGVTFSNPIGLSAGFDKAIEMPQVMKAVGFGFMTGGSVTYGEYEGNEGDWFYRLPKSKSIVVHAGLPSEGTPVVAARLESYSSEMFANFPLSVSVAKTNSRKTATDKQAIADYTKSLAVFDGLQQVSLLEINISCPNTFGGEPFTDAERLEKLLAAVDKLQLSKPVLIKMPISLPLKEFDALLLVIARHNIAGVTIGNLLKDRKKAKLQDSLPKEIRGNLSGAPNRDISTQLISRTYQKYGDKLLIIGVGGVMSAEHAYDKIRAGATLVELITGLMFEGPQLVGDINHQLTKLLKRDGYQNVSEAVGAAHKSAN